MSLKKILILHGFESNSRTDPVIPIEHGKNFAKNLRGRLHILHGFTHFDKIDLDYLKRLIK